MAREVPIFGYRRQPGSTPGSQYSSAASVDPELVVPFAIGRNRIKPVVIFNAAQGFAGYTGACGRTVTTFQQVGEDTDQLLVSGNAVDAVLAICQAGGTLQGIWRDKAYVGQRWSGSSWYSVGTSIWRALRRLQSCADVGGHYGPHMDSSGTPPWIPGAITAAPHEFINSTTSPYGKRYASTDVIYGTETYNDITGASYPRWAYLDGSPYAGMGFHGLTHLRCERLALSLEIETALPPIEFLVDTFGGPEVHPVTAVRAILEQLLGEPSANIVTDVGPDGRPESSYQRWCDSMPDLRVNGLVTGSPKEALDEILACTNAELVQEEGKLKIWPLGDAVTGSYIPSQWDNAGQAWTPIILDRRETRGLISVRIVEDSEVFNSQAVRYLDRAADYKESLQVVTDDWHASQYGKRIAGSVTSKWISTAKAANLFGQFLVRRSINQRKRLTTTISGRWAALGVGDLVLLGDGIYSGGAWSDIIGVPPTLCRIASKKRRDDGHYDIVAWEWSYGAVHPIDYTPDQPAAPVTIEGWSTAGAYATAQVAAALPAGTNLCPNGDFSSWDGVNKKPTGWETWGSYAVSDAAVNHASGDWSLLRNLDQYNTGWLNTPYERQDGIAPGDPAVLYHDINTPPMPVVPGRRYCASAYTGAHRCKVSVILAWYRSDGSFIDQGGGDPDNDEQASGHVSGASSLTLDGCKRCFSYGDAPADAVSARLIIRKWNTKTGYSDSYRFVCRAQFEELRPTSTEPGPWCPPASNGTAASAAAQAAAANAELANIASDNILSPVEKPAVIRDYSVITSEQAGIDAQATAAGVSRTAYDAAVTALTTYLGTLTSPTAWNDTSGSTTIVGTTFRTKFSDVYTAKQALLNAISAAKVSQGSFRVFTRTVLNAVDFATITIDPPMADTNYTLLSSPEGSSGSPPSGAFIVKSFDKQTNYFGVQFSAAPGSGNSVAWRFLTFKAG